MSDEEQTCRRFQVTVDRSSLSPLLGLSGRQSGQRRRDLSAFGLTAGGHNIVVNEARGQWACVHRGRLRGAVEAAHLPITPVVGLGVAEALRGFSQPRPCTGDGALRPRTKGGGDIRAVASEDARLLLGRIRLADRPRGCSAKGTTSLRSSSVLRQRRSFFGIRSSFEVFTTLVHFRTLFSCSQSL